MKHHNGEMEGIEDDLDNLEDDPTDFEDEDGDPDGDEIYESSYTSDYEDGDPAAHVCDMPDDEREAYRRKK